MTDLLLDERAILTYLAAVAENDPAGFVSLKGMLGEDKADLPREDFSRADWERMTDLYFAVRNLLMMGLVGGIAADGGEYLNRFRITGAGREVLRDQSGASDAASLTQEEPMTYPDTNLGRVEMFVTALEYRGHGKSIVSCCYGHEADCAGADGEYVPLHAGDLRDVVDQNKAMRRELMAELDRVEAVAALDDDLDDPEGGGE